MIEFYTGQKVFEGDIETFTLSGHPKAGAAFAWAFHNGTEPQYIAVLKVPQINDPSDAVRAAIASKAFPLVIKDSDPTRFKLGHYREV